MERSRSVDSVVLLLASGSQPAWAVGLPYSRGYQELEKEATTGAWGSYTSFIYSFIQQVFTEHYVPDTVLGSHPPIMELRLMGSRRPFLCPSGPVNARC